MNDPGEPELNGGLVYTHYGKGTYIYTGLAFFRQLPEGVPGAYRLFINLLGALHAPSGKGSPQATAAENSYNHPQVDQLDTTPLQKIWRAIL